MSAEHLLLELSGLGTPELRQRLALAHIAMRDAKIVIETEELAVRNDLLASVGGNPKELGANEQLREDRYRSAYGRNERWIRAKAALIEAVDSAEILEAVLNGRLDRIGELRLDADNQRTTAIMRLAESGAPMGALA